MQFSCLTTGTETAAGALTEAANQKKRLLWEIPDTILKTD